MCAGKTRACSTHARVSQFKDGCECPELDGRYDRGVLVKKGLRKKDDKTLETRMETQMGNERKKVQDELAYTKYEIKTIKMGSRYKEARHRRLGDRMVKRNISRCSGSA